MSDLFAGHLPISGIALSKLGEFQSRKNSNATIFLGRVDLDSSACISQVINVYNSRLISTNIKSTYCIGNDIKPWN